MDRVVFSSNFSVAILYLCFSLFGGIQFGDKVDPNILSDYPPNDILVTVARIIMAIHVALAFPLLLWPTRNMVDTLMFKQLREGEIETQRQRYFRLLRYHIILLS